MASNKINSRQLFDFSISSHLQSQVNWDKLKGKNIILYFYPKDSTPGCTLEGQQFNHLLKDFAKLDVVIFGVSRDSVKSHQNFCQKQGYQFELLSDVDEKLCQLFDVIKEKNMYGKKVIGIERSTFVLNSKGDIVLEYRKVKADGHAAAVLKDCIAHFAN